MSYTNNPWTLPSAELKSFPEGANSPGQAAFINQQNQIDYQTRLAKLGGRKVSLLRLVGRAGARTRRRRGGATNEIPIYTPTVPYDEPNTGSQSIAAINKNITSTLVQNQANSVYDKLATVKGGKGKKRHHKKSKKTKRKSRKSRRR